MFSSIYFGTIKNFKNYIQQIVVLQKLLKKSFPLAPILDIDWTNKTMENNNPRMFRPIFMLYIRESPRSLVVRERSANNF